MRSFFLGILAIVAFLGVVGCYHDHDYYGGYYYEPEPYYYGYYDYPPPVVVVPRHDFDDRHRDRDHDRDDFRRAAPAGGHMRPGR